MADKRSVPETLIQKILDILRGHPEGVDRRRLVELTAGRQALDNIANDLDDRDNRTAIQTLRNRGIHIRSSSRGGGYSLAENCYQVESTIAELESRRERIAEEIRGMRRTYGIPPPEIISIPEHATQLELLDE